MSRCRILVLQPLCKYSSPRAMPIAIWNMVLFSKWQFAMSKVPLSYMNPSRDPLVTNSYIRALLLLSQQNPKRETILTCDVLLMLATSLINSSPLSLDLLKTFTATIRPSGNFPLYTTPNPPSPTLSLNDLVSFFRSE
ncbi:hypothetical protein CIPAW_03G062500 [Carya illinoinensis]|uniref:Uncharacterized protein n=1 Tax=Carya illinoinensis TaxID=32201 RepID=A0A8T1QZD7_CARIL|nr:hypothetical protein CIPAW_03G062500 [Carya illinoinensis]